MPPQAAAEAPFVLKKPTSFWWTVRIPVPDDDDYQIAHLKCLFAWMDQATFDKLRGVGLAEGESAPTDEQIFRRVLLGWQGLADESGAAVPFSEEARAQLEAHTLVRSSIVATYMAVMSGVAARKNASPPPAAG